MYISALNRDMPLAYTVEAQTKIAEKAGRLDDIQNLFENEDSAKTVENTVWMLAVMMEASVNREKVKAAMFGNSYDGPEAPTYEQLRMILTVPETYSAMAEIRGAMSIGEETTVEVKEEKKKNAKATQ